MLMTCNAASSIFRGMSEVSFSANISERVVLLLDELENDDDESCGLHVVRWTLVSEIFLIINFWSHCLVHIKTRQFIISSICFDCERESKFITVLHKLQFASFKKHPSSLGCKQFATK